MVLSETSLHNNTELKTLPSVWQAFFVAVFLVTGQTLFKPIGCCTPQAESAVSTFLEPAVIYLFYGCYLIGDAVLKLPSVTL